MSTVIDLDQKRATTGEPADDRSLGRLIADATRDLSGLVRDELDLAKAELRDDVKLAVRGSTMFAAAGALALMASILLSVAAAYAITALGLHPAWAFLIVGGTYVLVAAILVLLGIRKVKQVQPPTRTIETTKESIAVLKGGSAGLS